MKVAPENVGFRKSTGRNKKEQLHAMPVCLRNEVVTEDTRSILPEFPNTAEHG